MDQHVNTQQITNKTLKTINKHNRFQRNGSSLKICSQKFERAKQQVQQFVLCHYILIVTYFWGFLFHKIRDKSAILTQCSKNSSCISSGCLICFFTLLAKYATCSQLHSLHWTPHKKKIIFQSPIWCYFGGGYKQSTTTWAPTSCILELWGRYKQGEINPVTHMFSTIYRGPISPYF